MSLGSRIVHRGTGAAATNLSLTPREPLLFLYPRWYRNTSTNTGPVSYQSQNDNLLQSSADESRAKGVKDSFRPGAYDDQTPQSPLPQSAQATTLHKPESNPRVKRLQLDRYADTPGVRRYARKLQLRRLKSEVAEEMARNTRQAYQTYVRAQKSTEEPDWRVILVKLENHTTKHGKWLDAAWTVFLQDESRKKLLYAVDNSIWEIARRHGSAVEIGEYKTLDDLMSLRLSGSAIAISRTAANVLQLAPGTEITSSPTRSVSLTTGLELENVARAIDLGGNSNDEEFTMQRDRHREPDRKPRIVMSRRYHPVQITRADNYPMPKEWTQETFARYVVDLTSLEIPNHLHRYLYKKGSHIDNVIETLKAIFSNPDCRASLSRKAYNTAIHFFVKTNNIDEARAFFLHMDTMEIPKSVETFNNLLLGAAKNQDLHNYNFIYSLMTRRRIAPNARTWNAFIMLNHSFELRMYIIGKMRALGLLQHRGAIKDACEQVVEYEINHSIDHGQSQEEFLKHMDRRWGSTWLSKDSSYRIIDALGARGLISRCVEFLYAMDDRHIRPDQACINRILRHCKLNKNITGVIEVLRNIPPSSDFVPDEVTYHTMFEIAWRLNAFNLSRVIWKYSCLNACTSRTMRDRVVTSLKNSLALYKSNFPRRQFFLHSAGLFITAIQFHKSHPVIKYRSSFKADFGYESSETAPQKEVYTFYTTRKSSAEDIDPSLLFTASNDNDISSEQKASLFKVSPAAINYAIKHSSRTNPGSLSKIYEGYERFIKYDLDVFQWYKPVDSLTDMLELAWERDRAWVADPTQGGKGRVGWMLHNGVHVRLTKKEVIENPLIMETPLKPFRRRAKVTRKARHIDLDILW